MARASFMRTQGGSMLPWLAFALILLIADQLTKVLILGYYQFGQSTTVTSFFNIVRAHNTGAAFSFLAAASGWQRWLFAGIAVAAALFVLYMLKTHPGQKLFCFAMACILAGAIGNLVDRIADGVVTDYLHTGWFPTFNLADILITFGAAALLWGTIRDTQPGDPSRSTRP